MSEQVNLESVKKVIRDEFRQQKDELTDAVYDRIAGTFTDFMKNIEDGQKGNLIEIKEQISKLNKKVVGWGWFIFILIVWSIIMFFAYVTYHNHYLKTGKILARVPQKGARASNIGIAGIPLK